MLLLVALVIGVAGAAFGVSYVMTSGSRSTPSGRFRVAAGIVAVALVACGNEAGDTPEVVESDTPATLDTDELAITLQNQIETRTGSNLRSVDCPAEVEIEIRGSFECAAEDEAGVRFKILVTQSDDQGSVTWEATDASP